MKWLFFKYSSFLASYGSYSARPVLLDIKPNSAKINWVPASSGDLPAHAGPFAYSLESRELPQRTWKRLATGIKGTSYNISDLNPDIEYMFRIKPEHKSIATEPTAPVTLPKRTGKFLVIRIGCVMVVISVMELNWKMSHVRNTHMVVWKKKWNNNTTGEVKEKEYKIMNIKFICICQYDGCEWNVFVQARCGNFECG